MPGPWLPPMPRAGKGKAEVAEWVGSIRVADREQVERGLRVRRPYVLISIRDPGRRRVRPKANRLCVAMMELAFHDAEPVPGFEPARPIRYMTEDDARAIWRFLDEHFGKYAVIVVQCEQGMSRSPSVAAAIAGRLGLDDTRFWRDYQPNSYIYKLVRSASVGNP